MNKKKTNIVKKISDIRSKNNINWMNLLKLALTYAPNETKKVLNEINKNDKKISQLVKKL